MMSKKSARISVAVAAGLVLCAALALGLREWGVRRFAVVEPGKLYRSGRISLHELERLARQLPLRRVICLNNSEHADTRAEAQRARQLGLTWENISLTGDGASTPADRDRLRALLLDDAAGPTLVHCTAGTNRTGLAVGIYRINKQHWTLAQVMDEMRRFDFEDLPKHENLRAALSEEARRASAQPALP